ncbi:hypothetical protein BGZ94_008905 [Podila epigama]|nr:hypothetical protein BGZ94_008905 [Podila epigama]
MSDKKGLYSPLPETEHEDDLNNRPPPYTPSTAPNSPFVAPHQTPNAAASSSSATAPPMPGQTSSLYPPLNYAGPHNPQHIPNYHSAGHSPNPAYPANPPHPASFSVTNTPQQAYPSYQATGYSPLPADHSKPPPPLPNPGQTSNTVPQVVHVRTPIRVEELKSKPNIVVCQHCRHLVPALIWAFLD